MGESVYKIKKMDNLIKSFKFESESIILDLYIKKEVYKSGIKMFIEGHVTTNNDDVKLHESVNGSSKHKSLSYKDNTFFWISSNYWKGMRWDNYDNATGFSVYDTLKEMKEQYINMREFITILSEYFYNCIKKYKEIKLLYETPVDDIISENE
jgi:hypothetical protein